MLYSGHTLRHIGSWDDLRPFGIQALTGEACGFSMRLLCDVTEEGKALLERFLGSTVTVKPDSNWNGGNSDNPHVGSVMLPRAILTDLAAFVLMVTGSGSVAKLRNGMICEFSCPLPCMDDEDGGFIVRRYRSSTDPGSGDRNLHMATGRLA